MKCMKKFLGKALLMEKSYKVQCQRCKRDLNPRKCVQAQVFKECPKCGGKAPELIVIKEEYWVCKECLWPREETLEDGDADWATLFG